MDALEPLTEVVGNPISLLVERFAYLAIGVFLIAALVTGVLREKESNDETDDC